MCNLKTVSLFIALCISILSFTSTTAQDRMVQFSTMIQENDTTGARKLLEDWEQATPKDPNLFIAQYNYYVNLSRQRVVGITRKAPSSDAFTIYDSTGKTVAYLDETELYDEDYAQKAFSAINKGIALYPNRLDMRFGKIYFLGQIKDHHTFTNEIITTIHYADSIKYKWRWSNNEPLDEARKMFYSSTHDYILTLYETGDDSLLTNMQAIANTVLKYNPDHVESLSDASIVYILKGDNESALKYLLRAEQIAPKDVIVLNNIAEAYARMKKKDMAITYLNKMIKYGNDEDKTYAQQKIDDLNK